MKRIRLFVGLIVLAAVAFSTGWAFRAYLTPEAVLDLANRTFLCN